MIFFSMKPVDVEKNKEKPKKEEEPKEHQSEINNATITNNFANKAKIPKYIFK